MQQRVFAVTRFLVNGSIVQTQRDFRRHFNIPHRGTIPNRNLIMTWVNNFNETGSVMKRRTGGNRTVRTPENIDRVRDAALRSPNRSVRLRASNLNLSQSTVRRILKEDLKFHPYKLVITQQLLEGDYNQRKLFCEQMQLVFNDNDNITLFTSDEAHFHLNGFVNRQNFRYWAAENPKELHEKPLHCPRVTVWCAVGKNTVIGPYFFEENGVTVTVNSDRYLTMLNEFFIPQLRRKRIPLRNVWFQQDGATCHTSNATMTFLRQKFPGRLISRRGDVSWPPRSPDLSPCDFFLWGYLKERVYTEKPRTLHELKEAISEEIRRIPRAMLGSVATSFISRLHSCITADGRHMLDVNFRT